MNDVAKLAGVSQKTVSRVVNSQPHVSADVHDRVAAAIAALGYRPNAAARALVTHRTRVLGVVTPGTALYGPSAQVFGIERAAWQRGYSVVISSTIDGSVAELARAVRQLVEHGVDGVVLARTTIDGALSSDLVRGVPVVSLGDPVDGDPHCPTFLPDQAAGARLATEHLLALGHATVWHVAGPTCWWSAAEREGGWRAALSSAGAPVHEPIEGDWTARAGYEAGLQLARLADVTAVFAANDQMATGLMRAFYEQGRRIPHEVSVVGFDDAPDSEYLLVPLTTVRQDFEAITARAVAELVDVVEGKVPTLEITLLPVELVVRGSSGPLPTWQDSSSGGLAAPGGAPHPNTAQPAEGHLQGSWSSHA